MLTCVYQSTVNSTQVTRDAALSVTNAIVAQFHVFDVDSLVRD